MRGMERSWRLVLQEIKCYFTSRQKGLKWFAVATLWLPFCCAFSGARKFVDSVIKVPPKWWLGWSEGALALVMCLEVVRQACEWRTGCQHDWMKSAGSAQAFSVPGLCVQCSLLASNLCDLKQRCWLWTKTFWAPSVKESNPLLTTRRNDLKIASEHTHLSN